MSEYAIDIIIKTAFFLLGFAVGWLTASPVTIGHLNENGVLVVDGCK